MRRLIVFRALNLLLVISALFSLSLPPVRAQDGPTVNVLSAKGAITPIVARYIERGIATAEANDAELLVIQLDTPGGSVAVMQEIVQTMIAADVPIAVYVAPEGAQAASAGTFVVLAGHIAAMAPNTTIGAASPVGGQGEDLQETAQEKAKNALAAQIKGLADRRGAAAVAWAEQAVRSAEAATAEQALDLGVVDYVVSGIPQLLAAVDGQEVELKSGTVTLNTAAATTVELPMSLAEEFLHTITDPNIAYILLILGLNGLLFELANPGGFLAGIVGVIALVLGFYALGVLNVNYTGLGLIALAFILFVLDIKAPTHGALTVGGIAAFVLGSLILFDTPLYSVSRTLIVTVALITASFFAFAVSAGVRAQRRAPTTGMEGLVGVIGHARSDLDPAGTVFVHGERWTARSTDDFVKAGDRVRIVGIDGFQLLVVPVETESHPSGSAMKPAV
jgi:membrane-bound serine protease (ClpP class)